MKFNSRARARVSGPGGACAGLVGVAIPLSGLMSSSSGIHGLAQKSIHVMCIRFSCRVYIDSNRCDSRI
jgi:hypothetical protein